MNGVARLPLVAVDAECCVRRRFITPEFQVSASQLVEPETVVAVAAAGVERSVQIAVAVELGCHRRKPLDAWCGRSGSGSRQAKSWQRAGVACGHSRSRARSPAGWSVSTSRPVRSSSSPKRRAVRSARWSQVRCVRCRTTRSRSPSSVTWCTARCCSARSVLGHWWCWRIDRIASCRSRSSTSGVAVRSFSLA